MVGLGLHWQLARRLGRPRRANDAAFLIKTRVGFGQRDGACGGEVHQPRGQLGGVGVGGFGLARRHRPALGHWRRLRIGCGMALGT
jgi:hypothetical protein